jgi:putative FmdB family regulatory protein
MPNREYICDNCEHSYEVYQPLHEELHKKCPKCKKNKLYQNLQGITGQIKEVKTLGQFAERQNKKLGKYGLEKRIKEEKDQADNFQRQRAAAATEKFGKKFVAACDKPESPIKPLSKETTKKLFSGDKKEQEKKIRKFIQNGE